jgi:hypothetical protein
MVSGKRVLTVTPGLIVSLLSSEVTIQSYEQELQAIDLGGFGQETVSKITFFA